MRLSQFLSLNAPLLVKYQARPVVVLAFGISLETCSPDGSIMYSNEGDVVAMCLAPAGGSIEWHRVETLDFPAPVQAAPSDPGRTVKAKLT